MIEQKLDKWVIEFYTARVKVVGGKQGVLGERVAKFECEERAKKWVAYLTHFASSLGIDTETNIISSITAERHEVLRGNADGC